MVYFVLTHSSHLVEENLKSDVIYQAALHSEPTSPKPKAWVWGLYLMEGKAAAWVLIPFPSDTYTTSQAARLNLCAAGRDCPRLCLPL